MIKQNERKFKSNEARGRECGVLAIPLVCQAPEGIDTLSSLVEYTSGRVEVPACHSAEQNKEKCEGWAEARQVDVLL